MFQRLGCHRFFNAILSLLVAVALAIPGPACAQARPLVIAYADGDQIFAWREGDPAPHRIAENMTGLLGGLILAPDARRFTFLREGALWLAEVDRAGARPLVTVETLNPGPQKSRRVLESAWLDPKTILFNTYLLSPAALVKQQYYDDLWRVDVATGEARRLLEDGQGGMFSASPDGKRIAVIHPGDYASQTRARISLIDPDGRNRVSLLDFPFVNTGASYKFYARVQWDAGGSRLYTAIPDPDLVYAAESPPPTALWELEVDGKATRIGVVRADFFGLPEFSADGRSVLYVRRLGAPLENRIGVFRAGRDGTGETEIARDAIGALEPAHWMPDGVQYTFVQGEPGELWLGSTDGRKRFGRSAEDRFFGPKWADATTLVYATTFSGAGELRAANPGSAAIPIARRVTGGDFDARREGQ